MENLDQLFLALEHSDVKTFYAFDPNVHKNLARIHAGTAHVSMVVTKDFLEELDEDGSAEVILQVLGGSMPSREAALTFLNQEIRSRCSYFRSHPDRSISFIASKQHIPECWPPRVQNPPEVTHEIAPPPPTPPPTPSSSPMPSPSPPPEAQLPKAQILNATTTTTTTTPTPTTTTSTTTPTTTASKRKHAKPGRKKKIRKTKKDFESYFRPKKRQILIDTAQSANLQFEQNANKKKLCEILAVHFQKLVQQGVAFNLK